MTARIPASFSTQPEYPTPSAGRLPPGPTYCAFPCSVPTWAASLWEVIARMATACLPPQLESGAAEPDGDDNGNWAANGKYYLFRALRGRVSSIYAMRAFRRFPRAFEGPPVLIYSTPMEFGSLAPHPDGQRIFFAAGQQRLELMRYDARHGQFAQFLSGVQGHGVNFSKDGQWIAYVTAPDDILWRSRPDGSERLQLTSPPMRASQPRWSPDGSRIVFGGGPPATPAVSTWSLPLVALPIPSPIRHRSTATRVGPPTETPWYLRDTACLAHPVSPDSIRSDLKTRKPALPGSDTLAQPAWSPDGRFIAATNQAGTQILLLNLDTRQWTPLVSGDGLGAPSGRETASTLYCQDALAPEQPIFRVAVGHAEER